MLRGKVAPQGAELHFSGVRRLMSGDGLSRDLAAARDAYDKGDIELSRTAHSSAGVSAAKKEQHKGEAGEYIQAVVFGGLDGITTTFAIIAASAAYNLEYGALLIVTFANLLADGLSMAVGDYLSSKAEDDHKDAERRRERWEMDHVPEKEKQEMVDVYVAKGVSQADAQRVVDLLWPHKDAFLDIMMIEELEIIPEESQISAWKSGIITFVSFFILGGIPVLPYLFSWTKWSDPAPEFQNDKIFWIATVIFLLCLFALGAYKAFITGTRWWAGGIIMILTGSITNAFAIGSAIGLEKATAGLE